MFYQNKESAMATNTVLTSLKKDSSLKLNPANLLPAFIAGVGLYFAANLGSAELLKMGGNTKFSMP
jgi:hypothetical protein